VSGEVVHTRLADKKTRRFIEEAYERAVERGLKLLTILTDGQPRQHNYRRQIFDAFPRVKFGSLLTVDYFANADHLFSDAGQRERLFCRIEDWLNDCRLDGTVETPPFPVTGMAWTRPHATAQGSVEAALK
jgi:hypothetical protein